MPESNRRLLQTGLLGKAFQDDQKEAGCAGQMVKKRKEAPVVRAQWEMGGQRGPQRPGHQP